MAITNRLKPEQTHLGLRRFFTDGWVVVVLAAPALLLFRELVTLLELPRSFISYFPWLLFLLIPFFNRKVLYSSLAIAALTSTYALWQNAKNNPPIPGRGGPPRTDLMELFGVMVNANAVISTVATCLLIVLIAEVLYWFVNRLNRLNSQLSLAVAKAEDAAMAKSRFLAVMSHEIRTPLSGILGMTQMIHDEEKDEQKRHSLQLVMDSADTLYHIVNSTLDFSRIEANQLVLQPEPFTLHALLNNSIEPFELIARRKRLRLEVDLHEDLDCLVLGDRHRLRQVIANLLSNAIKFTPSGTIAVRAKAQRNDQGLLLSIEVEDTGIGIAEDQQGKLFNPFEQVNSSYTRSSEGTGLGLAIAREIARNMQGDLWVQSRLGQGSCFSLQVQLGWPNNEQAEQEPCQETSTQISATSIDGKKPTDATQGVRVLVAEDNPVNMLYITRLLSNLGCEVTQAENGQEAVNAYQDMAFDVIFMDIQMPQLSGLDATQAIRQFERVHQRAPTPIYALSACVTEQDQRNVLESGFDGFCSKPVNISQIKRIVGECLAA